MPRFSSRHVTMDKALKKRDFRSSAAPVFIIVGGLAFGSSIALGNVRPTDLVSLRNYDLSTDNKVNEAYAAQGYRAGDLIFFPAINNTLQYTDNVYATEKNRESDMVYAIQPQLKITSDFVRHSVSASFNAEHGIYNKITSEDYTDYSANLGAKLDITGQTSLPFGISYNRDHYRRGSLDDAAAKNPTTFDLYGAAAGLIHRGQTIALKLLSDFKRYVFKDDRGTAGVIDNSGRNRDEFSLYSSVGFAEEAFFAPFLYSEITKIKYDGLDRNGRDRSAFNYEAGAGSIFNISDVTRAAFHIGHVNHEPENGSFSSYGAFTYGANIIWSPSTLASFQLEGERTVQESFEIGSSGRIDNRVRLSMNYELFSNMFLKPYAGVQYAEYEGIDKDVRNYSAGLDMTYKMNRNIWLSTTYGYINQNEQGRNSDDEQYDTNTYGLSLKLQF